MSLGYSCALQKRIVFCCGFFFFYMKALKKKDFLTLNQILISFKNLSSIKILYIVIFIKGAGATLRSVIGNVTTMIE